MRASLIMQKMSQTGDDSLFAKRNDEVRPVIQALVQRTVPEWTTVNILTAIWQRGISWRTSWYIVCMPHSLLATYFKERECSQVKN